MGDGFSINSTGLVCPTCRAKLRVLQWRPLFVSILAAFLFVGFVVLIFGTYRMLVDPDAFLPVLLGLGVGLALLIAAVFASAFFQDNILWRFARLQVVHDDTWLTFPLSRGHHSSSNPGTDVHGGNAQGATDEGSASRNE
jgi:hypothetical protein